MLSCVLVAAVLSVSGGNQTSLPSSQAAESHAVTKRTVLFPAQKFATGGWGMGIDAADLDGDGLLDLVTSLWSANEVSVLIGKPGGAFRDPVRYPSGEAPYNVAVGDLDGDGKPDVVGANYGYQSFTDGNLTVHLNNGDGTLLPAVGYGVGKSPTDVLIEDVNADGFADLISANSDSFDVTVLAGVGDGTFQTGVSYLAGSTPWALGSGRLNEDPFLDLVVATWGANDVELLIGGPGGSFTNAGDVDVGSNPAAVELVDVDGDGIDDILTAETDSNQVSVLLGLGGASFAPAHAYEVGDRPSKMVVADLDRDGLFDVATANLFSGDVSVLTGLGAGVFRPERRYPAGDGPDGLVAGYLDQDAWLDLAISNISSDATVLRGSRRGMIAAEVLSEVDGPRDVEVADVNGDGLADLLAVDVAVSGTTANPALVQVWLATASGAWVTLAPFAVGDSSTDLACVDLDGDSMLDLVVANYDDGFNGAGDVRFFHGAGDGTFSAGAILVGGSGPRSVEVLDLSGDGLLDISLLTHFSGLLTYVNDGLGGYVQSTTPVAGQPTQHAVGDLNGDAIPDIAVPRTSMSDIQIHLGLGPGAYAPGATIPVGPPGEWAYDVELADLNGDGLLDLAAGTGYQSGVFIGLGLGNGQFAPASPLLANNNQCRYLVLEDFDADGALDVAVSVDTSASTGFGGVNVFYGRGDGTFHPYRAFAGGSGTWQLASGDVTGDALPDLALVNMGSFNQPTGNVFVYRNLLKPKY